MAASEDNPNRRGRSPVMIAVTVGVVLLVAWFVGDTVRESWTQLAASGLQVRWSLLGLSGVVYLMALFPMAWYWRRVVAAVDRPVAWRPLLTAYYAGHLGKYVPGKAMVVVIRAAMLKLHGGAAGPLAVSVFVETLTMMATGAAIAALLLITGATNETASPLLIALAVGMALLAAAPTLPPVLRVVVKRLAKSSAPAPDLSWRLLAVGWLSSVVTWLGLGLSLWIAVVGCGGEAPNTLATARVMLLATTLPFVAGFLSLIPGGLVVRDALMLRLLAPTVGHGPAFAAAAAARLVWITAELLIYGMMMAGHRGGALPTATNTPATASPSPATDESPPTPDPP